MSSINGVGNAYGHQKYKPPVVLQPSPSTGPEQRKPEPEQKKPTHPARQPDKAVVVDETPETSPPPADSSRNETTVIRTVERIYTENTTSAFDPRVDDLVAAVQSLLDQLGEQADATTSLADQVNALAERLDQGVEAKTPATPVHSSSESLRGANITISLGGGLNQNGSKTVQGILGRVASASQNFSGISSDDIADLLTSSLTSSQIRSLVGSRDASIGFESQA